MSLILVKDFLLSEIEVLNEEIVNYEKLIKDNDLKIDEANYFINELNNNSKELSSTYFSEKHKEEKLLSEKENLNNYLQNKKEYESILNKFQNKKILLEENIAKIDDLINQEDSKKRSKKNNKDYIIEEMNSSFDFFENSLDKYSHIDPQRINIDYKLFKKQLLDIINNI